MRKKLHNEFEVVEMASREIYSRCVETKENKGRAMIWGEGNCLEKVFHTFMNGKVYLNRTMNLASSFVIP